jgi:hypothetical protein
MCRQCVSHPYLVVAMYYKGRYSNSFIGRCDAIDWKDMLFMTKEKQIEIECLLRLVVELLS